MADIEKERMRAALELIAGNSCDRSTVGPGSCWGHAEWTPDAQYTDDRWCDKCIARAALLPVRDSFREQVNALALECAQASRPAQRR